ncbi:MAG: ferrous iron transport protein A [Deltaproteobacteria bacterium]|nr:ferrous iron transport protein A [Deltaproteobacteria bacterium]
MTKCPLCQREFDEQNACRGCGLRKGCQLWRCPYCHYEFVEKSSLIDFLKRIGSRFKKEKTLPVVSEDPLVISLTEGIEGENYQVVFVRPRHEMRLNHLASFGVVPGSEISLHQKRPAFVIQAGETEIALEETVVKEIFVKKTAP